MENVYGFAGGLVGFPISSLRVRITRMEDGYIWCVTADLIDAGTPLLLDARQVLMETPEYDVTYVSGLLTFA